MKETIDIALLGIAGYGRSYVDRVLDEFEGKNVRIVGAVARRPERCARLAELKARGAEIYPDLDRFYAHRSADLVIISSPISLHRQHTCAALAHGSNVLCEKPVAATIQESLDMAEAARRAGRFVGIGYQWSFSDGIQALKQDVMKGTFGRPLCMKTIVFWPRQRSYYKGGRNWAAVIKDEEGNWVLDSPVQNATAHFLHNIFYVLGKTRETSAMPTDIQAELYRANDIENYDTAALRCHTEDGVEVLFYTSHAASSEIGPVICYRFEEAVVYHEMNASTRCSNVFIARFRDGRFMSYANPEDTGRSNKVWQCVEAVRTGLPVACGIEASIPQVLCVNGAQDSADGIAAFPEKMIKQTGKTDDPVTSVESLQAAFLQCYDLGILPSEHGALEWARSGKPIDLRNYRRFPGGA